MWKNHVYFGQYYHSLSFNEYEAQPDGFMAIKDGKIIAFGRAEEFDTWDNPIKKTLKMIQLPSTAFLMPGFIDTHIHAPQVPNIGLGLDKPLLDWLNTYTFPMETQYQDKDFAEHVYQKVVRKTLECGTTTATYFATIHLEGSKILVDQVIKQGQRALVGKVSSNQFCPPTYIETTKSCLEDNEAFVHHVLNLADNTLVRPIITPRFAITCSMPLMEELGKLAAKNDLHIQSHISENLKEIEGVLEMYPGSSSYADVYDKANLLTKKCILAHGVHLEDNEIDLLSKKGTSISHCPNSNTNLKSGLCDVKRLIAGGVKVGLGTDISGGNRISMLDSLRSALDVSHHLSFMKKQNVKGTGKVSENVEENLKYEPLTYHQAIFLATLGGAEALSMEHQIGNFQIGKEFDAILVDISAQPIDQFSLPAVLTQDLSAQDILLQQVQKFVYVGDDRNIVNVLVKDVEVKASDQMNSYKTKPAIVD